MAQTLNVLKFESCLLCILHSYKLHKCNVSGMYDGSYVNNRNTSKEKKVTSVTLKVYNAGLYIYVFNNLRVLL